MKRFLVFLIGLCAVVMPLNAANPKSDFTQEKSLNGGSRLRTEWGLTGAIYCNNITLSNEQGTPIKGLATKSRLGFGAGLHMALKIGNLFAIQPEINYHRSSIKSTLKSKHNNNVKINTVDIPVLLSLRFENVVRINAGPLFTVMNNSFYTDPAGEKQMFGASRPTLGYSAGAAVVLFRKLMVDVRYIGYFKETLNNYEGVEFNSKINSISLKVGYMF